MARGNATFGGAGDRNSASREQFVMDETSFSKPKKGCFLTRPVGFVLVLVAALVAAGVGLGVYFLAPRYNNVPEAQQWSDCLSLAEKRGECACPDSLTTTTVAPTTEIPQPTTTVSPPLPTGNRLNRTLIPSHYKVELWPRFYPGDDFGFNGSVVIDMKCHEATDVIVMNSYLLTIHEATVMISRTDDNKNTTLSVTRWEEDVPRQFVKFYLGEKMVQNATYQMSMQFNGTHIHDDFSGFYRSSYQDDGVTKWLVTTQFQRTDARRAFPCFDEPSFKATFDITLVRRSDHSSISNMDLKSQDDRYHVVTFMAPSYARRVFPCFDEPSFKANFDVVLIRRTGFSTIANMPLKTSEDRGNGYVADVYNTTVVMSPYLLAFVVSEFQYKEATTPRGTYMRLWARPKFVNQLDYALSISGTIMEALEDYTGIKYPLPKTDQIAIPDFSAGAMENWGLVTYRETALLVNDNYTDTSSKRYVASVIAHELAHYWWGNLVTCEWWDETWLNEGFANNYAEPMADSAEPTWKLNEYFIRTVWGALELDGVPAQPVFVAGIEHTSELGRGFSSITYRKGGSVIRMMKYFLSEETFRSGISTYLNRHAYGNTRRADLYKALEEQAVLDGQVSWDTSKANFTDIMETWIAQMGHPVVDIADWGNGTLQVSQKHFMYDEADTVSPSPVGKNGEYVWHIPLTFADKDQLAANNNYSRFWIYGDKSSMIDGVSATGWKVVNLFEQGFYRVRYSDAIWESILQQLKDDHTVFPSQNRGKLINDAFNLARAGMISEVNALRATEYLPKETEYLPIYAGLVTRLRTVENWLYPTSLQYDMNQYVYNLVLAKYDTTSWDNSDPKEHLEKYVRTMILRENCNRRHKPCLDKAAELYASFMSTPDNNPIHPDFRSFVYCTAIDIGGAAEFEHARNRLEQVNDTLRHEEFVGYEMDYLRNGMACVRQPYLVQRYLDYAVEKRDLALMRGIAGRWQAQGQVWDFLVQNWNNASIMDVRTSVLNTITTYWSTDIHIKKVEDLARENPVPSWDRTFEDVLDKIKNNAKWVQENQKPIGDWLASVNGGSYYSQSEVQSASSRQRRDVTVSRHEDAIVQEDRLQYVNAIE